MQLISVEHFKIYTANADDKEQGKDVSILHNIS
jgi:hypothetical protein